MGKPGVTRIANTFEREGVVAHLETFAEIDAVCDAILEEMDRIEYARRSALLTDARDPTTFKGKRAILQLASRYHLTLPLTLNTTPAPFQDRIRTRARLP